MEYNDGLCPGGRRPRLYLIVGQVAHKFKGVQIPGVCAIAGEKFDKNGKWSNTTYQIELKDGVRPIYLLSPLHGTWGNEFPTWHECASQLGLPLAVTQSIVRAEYPPTADRLDAMEEFMNEEGESQVTETLLSWKDDSEMPTLVRGQEEVIFKGESIAGFAQIIRDESNRTGLRKYRRWSYWVALPPGVEVKKGQPAPGRY
jgi:hypothetical protein